jgi:hypothetical protein
MPVRLGMPEVFRGLADVVRSPALRDRLSGCCWKAQAQRKRGRKAANAQLQETRCSAHEVLVLKEFLKFQNLTSVNLS